MKLAVFSFAVLLAACGSPASNGGAGAPQAAIEPTVTQGSAPEVATPVEMNPNAGSLPKHGGTMVLAGDYTVEVLPRNDGSVLAYVHDTISHAMRPDQITLTVKLGGEPIALAWNANTSRYEGRFNGPPAALALDVEVVAHNQPMSAHADLAPIVTPDLEMAATTAAARNEALGAQTARGGVAIAVQQPASGPPVPAAASLTNLPPGVVVHPAGGAFAPNVGTVVAAPAPIAQVVAAPAPTH